MAPSLGQVGAAMLVELCYPHSRRVVRPSVGQHTGSHCTSPTPQREATDSGRAKGCEVRSHSWLRNKKNRIRGGQIKKKVLREAAEEQLGREEVPRPEEISRRGCRAEGGDVGEGERHAEDSGGTSTANYHF